MLPLKKDARRVSVGKGPKKGESKEKTLVIDLRKKNKKLKRSSPSGESKYW